MKTTTQQRESDKAKMLFYFALITFLVSTMFFSAGAFAQCRCGNGGYTTSIYQNTILASNVQYTQNASANFDGTNEQETLDIWAPVGDNCTKHPVIIWVHGGGFAINDKSAPDVVAMCDSFSRKGFVCATINYRDGYWGQNGPVGQTSTDPTPYDVHEFTRADYRAMQDAKCAIRFFKANASAYGIDTSNIFMGGTSAGGWTSLMSAYLNRPSEKFSDCFQQSTVAGIYPRADLGNINGTGGWNNVSSNLRGIISIFGAVPDTSIIDGHNDVPAIFFHEYGDPVVNFYYGAPFQGQYQNFASYWGDYYVNMQLQHYGETHKSFWINGSQHNLYPYRGLVTAEVSKFLDSLVCTTNATAVNEMPNEDQLSVFPNPSTGDFTVNISENIFKNGDVKIQVYNAVGEAVYNETVNQNKSTIDLSGRSSGIYYVKINSGETALSEKVLIAR